MSNPIFLGQFSTRAPPHGSGPYIHNILFGQFGMSSLRLRAVDNFVRLVVDMGGPAQIIRRAVRSRAVNVCDFMAGSRLRSVECAANKAVHQPSDKDAFVPKHNRRVTVEGVRLQHLAHAGAVHLLNSDDHPLARNGVIWRLIYYFEKVVEGRQQAARWVIGKVLEKFGIVAQKNVSHVVSPYVRGQGRALLKQRFRPVLYNGIALCAQAGGR